jgi:hypothetical protein
MPIIPYLETIYVCVYIYIYIYIYIYLPFIIDKCEGDRDGGEKGKNGKL